MLRESSDGITDPVDNPSLVYPEPPAFAEYMCQSSADLKAAARNWRSLDCRAGESEIGKERNVANRLFCSDHLVTSHSDQHVKSTVQ